MNRERHLRCLKLIRSRLYQITVEAISDFKIGAKKGRLTQYLLFTTKTAENNRATAVNSHTDGLAGLSMFSRHWPERWEESEMLAYIDG